MDDALFRPETREAFAHLVAQGWTDALRKMHPNERIYTFWDYFRNNFGRDAGLRIDHLLLSPSISGRLVSAGVDREVRGWEKASDHAPTWITIDEQLVSATLSSCVDFEASTNARRPAEFPRDVALAPSAAGLAPSLDRRQR